MYISACSMNWQFPVHITGTRATISMLLTQRKKCNQNRRKSYSVNSFHVMTTGISLCVVILPCNFPVRVCSDGKNTSYLQMTINAF